MASEQYSASEIVTHHLEHWRVGEGIWAVHMDTIFFSVLCGVLMVFLLWLGARKATAGVPSKMQNFVELLVEFADNSVKATFHGPRDFMAPLALTIFLWVLFWNFLDLVPIDWIPLLGKTVFGLESLKIVPSADINATFGLSISVLMLIIYYGIKGKGALGFGKELLTHPFGSNPLLVPFNLILNLVEMIAKPISLAMRLFGNLFAAELIFILISLLPFWILWAPDIIWALFHLLVVPLQAFLFMTLTIIYISLAYEDQH